MPMAIALVTLAVGSVLAGYVSLGGRFEHFLEPVFDGRVTEAVAERSSELMLVGASIVAAFAGIGLAVYFYLLNRGAADRVAKSLAGPHELLLNKYYVDEIYDAAVVQPIQIVSEQALWKGIDAKVIDGAVNGVGDVVSGWSALTRRAQTGSVRAYAASLLVGVVAVLGYFLWR
jgi:NADH-quinone oxidoreductase subunit L